MLSKGKIDEIVELTGHFKPPGQTHWSGRTMAKKVGVSPATVRRIWAARGLKPHLVNTFKLSDDPRFVWTAKADDILAKVQRGRVALRAANQN